MKLLHKGDTICSECGTILSSNKNYKFRYTELSNKEFREIIENAKTDRSAFIKLTAIVVFVLQGNPIVIKNGNGRSNTGIFYNGQSEKFLSDLKKVNKIQKVQNIIEWVNYIADTRLLAMITDELYGFANYRGYLGKLYDD